MRCGCSDESGAKMTPSGARTVASGCRTAPSSAPFAGDSSSRIRYTPHTLPRAMFENVSRAESRRSLVAGGAAHDGSRAWVTALQGPPSIRDEALAELHELLLRGARFELSRSGHELGQVPRRQLDALVNQAADDALITVLAKLEGFRGTSRFTTWAAKFALRDARHKLRAAQAGAATGIGTTLH